MLDPLFTLSAPLQFLCFLAYGIFLLVANLGLMHWLGSRYRTNKAWLPVGPAFQTVTVLFALLTGFLASDIWSQQRQAVDAAFKEGLSLQRLYQLAHPDILESIEAIKLLDSYETAAFDVEWGMHFNRTRNPSADDALKALRTESIRLSDSGKSAFFAAEWLRSVNDLEDARYRRLLIGVDSSDSSQWITVLLLAFFAAAGIAACHMDRPPAGRLILSMFALSITITFWQLSRHTNPYTGGDLAVAMPRVLAGK